MARPGPPGPCAVGSGRLGRPGPVPGGHRAASGRHSRPCPGSRTRPGRNRAWHAAGPASAFARASFIPAPPLADAAPGIPAPGFPVAPFDFAAGFRALPFQFTGLAVLYSFATARFGCYRNRLRHFRVDIPGARPPLLLQRQFASKPMPPSGAWPRRAFRRRIRRRRIAGVTRVAFRPCRRYYTLIARLFVQFITPSYTPRKLMRPPAQTPPRHSARRRYRVHIAVAHNVIRCRSHCISPYASNRRRAIRTAARPLASPTEHYAAIIVSQPY